mmetsp:Transcript_25491/g.65632  ORF Transcript_25491/g.65632 Transcript_25491/m.65632 type:complete len:261 (+) Transcript_25491:1354-2136(+)
MSIRLVCSSVPAGSSPTIAATALRRAPLSTVLKRAAPPSWLWISASIMSLSSGLNAVAFSTCRLYIISASSSTLLVSRQYGRISSLPGSSRPPPPALTASWCSFRHQARVKQTPSGSITTSVRCVRATVSASVSRSAFICSKVRCWLNAKMSTHTMVSGASRKRSVRQCTSSRNGRCQVCDVKYSGGLQQSMPSTTVLLLLSVKGFTTPSTTSLVVTSCSSSSSLPPRCLSTSATKTPSTHLIGTPRSEGCAGRGCCFSK